MRLTRVVPPTGAGMPGPGSDCMRAKADGAGLRGSMTALVTPFRGDRIDEKRLFALCEQQVRAGTSALIVSGSTGEGPALCPAEQSRVLAIALEASLGRVAVVAGCGAPATEAAVALAASAARGRANALLVAPPPYSRPNQAGIVAHVRAVAAAAERPVILYDVPGRTGVAIEDATVAQLFQAGLIVGLKDAAGDLSRVPRLRALCGEGLALLSGDDGTAAGYRAMGGQGCISVTANVVPGLCAAMHRAWDCGDWQDFARLRDMLAPLHEALFIESNPIPVKAAMELAGLCDSRLRLPLTGACAVTVGRLATILPPLLAAEDEAVSRFRSGMGRLSLVH